MRVQTHLEGLQHDFAQIIAGTDQRTSVREGQREQLIQFCQDSTGAFARVAKQMQSLLQERERRPDQDWRRFAAIYSA
jgi:hypothetical protein